jgi:ABC-type multidrug transport system fused ATPase/permease subunit
MLLGAVAELVTIGAVLPFLALISDPTSVDDVGAIGFVFGLLGWTSGEPKLFPAAAILALAAVFAGVARLWLTWVTQAFVFRFGHEVGVAIYARMLRQPYLCHVARNSSEAIAGVEKVQTALFAVLMPVMQALVATFMSIFIIAALVAIDPAIALISAAVVAAIYTAISLATNRWLRRMSQTAGDAHTQRIQQVQEGLGGIRDILLDKSQAVFERAFTDLDQRLRRAQTASSFIAAAPRLVIESLSVVLIAGLALHLSSRDGGLLAAIPVLGAIALGAQRLLPLLQTIYSAGSRTTGSLYMLHEITCLASAPLPPIVSSEEPMELQRELTFEKVSFTYPGSSRSSLSQVDLTIKRGERIGLVGETGSGKSTLLDVLMGLLDPTSGRILIDGTQLTASSKDAWQAQIAHVPQFIYLSDGSIAANIAFGVDEESLDMARVREAARVAQIAELVDALPEDYDSRVGERGVRFSGGQRQRIGIARALYKRASILILDEATSALDDQTEAAVIDGILSDRPEVTIVMVAHRLTTLANCNQLFRLQDGQIAQCGTFEDLVTKRAELSS